MATTLDSLEVALPRNEEADIETIVSDLSPQTVEHKLDKFSDDHQRLDYLINIIGSPEADEQTRGYAQAKARETNARIKETSMKDTVTGVWNRTFELQEMPQEIARTRRNTERLRLDNNPALTYILVDLDGFKDANDVYGHGEGDRILTRVAQVLERNIRGAKVIRRGGDEYGVIAPETTVEQAKIAAERARVAIEREFGQYGVTASFGVANYTGHINDPYTRSIDGRPLFERSVKSVHEELVAKADAALYSSKEKGKNQVTVWEPSIVWEKHIGRKPSELVETRVYRKAG